jgi:hypothetical protein
MAASRLSISMPRSTLSGGGGDTRGSVGLASYVDGQGDAPTDGMHKDKELELMSQQYEQMMGDLNNLGDGLAESLKRAKDSFSVNHRFARVVDRYYNGAYDRDFALEAEGSAKLSQHENVRRYMAIWAEASEKHRPSAASVNVDRAMNPLRYFTSQSGFGGPVKQKQRERGAALKEATKRMARLKKLRSAWRPNQAKIQTVTAELESEQARYRILNTELKQLILKEKIARDSLVEDYVITTICCQAEIYRTLARDLSDLVQQLPADKVLRVQSQITDLVQLGGPEVRRKDPTNFGRLMNAALGTTTLKEQRAEQAAEDVSRLQDEAARRQQMTELAAAEDQVRRASLTANQEQPPLLPQYHQPPQPPQQQEQQQQPPPPHHHHHSQNSSNPPPPPSQQQSSPFDGAALVETVLALFKHDVSEEDELPFDAGDEVQVISKDDSGWWQGRNVKTGAVGIFPANYTRPKTTKLPPGFRGLVNTQQDL